MKRNLFETSSNQEYDEINQLQKQLYEQNQLRMKEQQEELIQIIDDNDEKFDQNQIQNEPSQFDQNESSSELCFKKGTFAINCLTQYPKDDKQKHMLPFINILYENAYVDGITICFYNIQVQLEQPKKTLQNVLMTCYGFQHELLVPIVKSNIKLILVNDNSAPNRKAQIHRAYEGFTNWTLILPGKTTFNTSYAGAFHPKIWILKFPHFLRIVIGSQNLHVGDWTIWSQCMWIQDFRKKTPNTDQKCDDVSLEFKMMLREFMFEILPKETNFEEMLELRLDDYDIRDINIRLICSLPGRYTGNQLYKYGQMRVYNVIYEELSKHKMKPIEKANITYQSTSLGALDENFIDQLSCHFSGKSFKAKDNKLANNYTLTQMLKQGEHQQLEQVGSNTLKLIYPTMDYIENQTHGGVDFADPLFLKKANFENPKYPKDIFHRFQGSDHYYWHTGIIPHLKVFIVTNSKNEINDDTIIYMGSHNMTMAAWGRLEKNASQININNTELGVLYPPAKDSAAVKQQLIESMPFKFPPEKYIKSDVPWIAEIYYGNKNQQQEKQ